jgi:hypothetical protein
MDPRDPPKSEPVDMPGPSLLYQVYVLRIWQDQAATRERPARLRFSLENPNTGNRRGFASFEAFVAFLQEELKPNRENKEIPDA